MSRTSLMAQLLRLARIAQDSRSHGDSVENALEREILDNASRRRFAQGAAAAAAVATAGAVAAPLAMQRATIERNLERRRGGRRSGGKLPSGAVAVVGAGIAGLACANELLRKGVNAHVYEASSRVGGRISTLRGYFPGQVVERGGEFINPSHHVMLGYARELGLTLEESSAQPGQSWYDLGGRRYSEVELAEELGVLQASMAEEFGALSLPTAERFGEAESLYDFMTLDELLTLHGSSDTLRKLIGSAYAAEYGAGIHEVSAMSFLRFVHGDKRTKFGAFGAQGETNFHVVDGNDRITTGLAARLASPVQLGQRLVAIRKLSGGQVVLTFDNGAGRTTQVAYDAVVLTVPFSVLRDVQIDASVGLPAWKRDAINLSAMGDNAKLMVGFKSSYWYLQHESNGTLFSDRERLQATWESNPTYGGEARGVLTSYMGGDLARAIHPRTLQSDAQAFLNDLEVALPGANAQAQRTLDGTILAASMNWSGNPYAKGSYALARPGYFTTSAHNEAKPVGNLFFAGEHTSSFYEWQGTMEGAALSGLRAAGEVCSLMRVA